jgi:hypothetical protein
MRGEQMLKLKWLIPIGIILELINFSISDIPLNKRIDNIYYSDEEKAWDKMVKKEIEIKEKESRERILKVNEVKENNGSIEEKEIFVESQLGLLKDNKAYEECLAENGNDFCKK